MRVLSLILALLLLAASIVLFTGGFGPILMASRAIDTAAGAAWRPGLSTAAFVLAWWAGIGICTLRFRNLLSRIASASKRGWQVGDLLVLLGHLALSAAVLSLALGMLTVRRELPIYQMLMAAALCYALGLAALALSRSTPRP